MGAARCRRSRVETGSRLHFGLIDPAGVCGRRFAGAGVVVEEPGVVVEAEPAADWSATGPLAERALGFARRYAEGVGSRARAALSVIRCPEDHVGLGTGTQIALASAAAIAALEGGAGASRRSAVELAALAGRGERSAIGVHGFDHGGFLVDGGRDAAPGPAPLACRQPVPSEWRFVLATPLNARGIHGRREEHCFGEIGGLDEARVGRLARLLILGMLPALAQADMKSFGLSLYEYGVIAGEPFRSAQGGTFARGHAADVAGFLRSCGVEGVGQSSWGPTVYAVVADGDEASSLRRRLSERWSAADLQVHAARARNSGASIHTLEV